MARKASRWRGIGRLASAVGAGWALYQHTIRPWYTRWGATDDEVARSMPGDDLVSGANYHTTRAITIAAPPEQVWPWLIQIGQGRGGFYSYDLLENLTRLDIHSADRIVPELQDLKIGDTIAVEPGGSGFRIVALEPERLLVCYIDGNSGGEMGAVFAKVGAASTWAFLLEPHPGGSTRLVVRWRAYWPLCWSLQYLLIGLLIEPVEFIMEQKMMRGIRERATP
jgi:hypothetical protein